MERKIAIVTDSSCDIPKELAEKYGIDVIDFPINLDGKEYYERRGMTMDQFYELMRAAQGVPTTAAITALQWREVYEAYADQGYTDVLHVSINSTGSSTYANAQQAAEQLRQDRPEMTMRIHLVDSHTYSMVFGWYLCECARKLRNGGDLRSCILELESKLGRVEVCLAAFSLKQLKKSGRVSAAAAFAGELLGLRPVISLVDGVTKVESKVRGDAGVLPALIRYAASHKGDPFEYMVGTTDNARGEELAKLCKKEFGVPPMCIFQLGSAVASNTGPDAIAIAFLGKPRQR